jgi:hypothetical protein
MNEADEVDHLYQEFVAAREQAIALTDRYTFAHPDDPRRPELWETAMRQTEVARLLLESWLATPVAAPVAGSRRRELVGIR